MRSSIVASFPNIAPINAIAFIGAVYSNNVFKKRFGIIKVQIMAGS
jgi:hypothetical protein